MELDFDKEINALLRQAARNGDFVSTTEQNHLDADEISAFAENALPEKTRAFYIKHFADCDRCRTILSNTILLNSEAETETASSAVAAPISEIVATKVPWYRKMFLMPNLAYTMGGLILIFGGMIAFSVLQNVNKSGSSDISQIQEKAPARSGGPNTGDEGFAYNSSATASNSNAAASNTATVANSASNLAASASNTAASESNSAISNTSIFSSEKPLSEPSAPGELEKQNPLKPIDDAKNETKTAKEAELSDKNKSDDARNDEIARATTDSAAPPPAPKAAPPLPSITMRRPESPTPENPTQTELSKKKRSNAVSGATNNTRQIGGKNFNRVGEVWIDSAYNRSTTRTKTIRRGSSEYQKLDRQVRIIAESLDGAVIVVWRDGAYRIQ